MVEAHQAALGALEANEVWMTNSAAGAIQADSVTVNGGAGAVMAGTAILQNANVAVVAGQQIKGDSIRTLLLVGRPGRGRRAYHPGYAPDAFGRVDRRIGDGPHLCDDAHAPPPLIK